MVAASALRPGMAIRLEGEVYKVITATFHSGGGQMGGVTHAKLRNVRTGAVREWRFRPEETVQDVPVERQTMQFLYGDDEFCHFMNTETFEQVAVERARLGRAAAFLADGMVLPVEFHEGRPIGVVFPEIVEARVAETAPPAHGTGIENVWKEAKLENGLTIQVPPFIAAGEWIRVDVEAGAYIERAKRK